LNENIIIIITKMPTFPFLDTYKDPSLASWIKFSAKKDEEKGGGVVMATTTTRHDRDGAMEIWEWYQMGIVPWKVK